MFSTCETVTGQYLAHTKLKPAARAFLGADLRQGRLRLVEPTMRQVVTLCGVSATYVRLAELTSLPQRQNVMFSDAPLAIVHRHRHPLALPKPLASDSELIELARHVGPERLFAAIEAVI